MNSVLIEQTVLFVKEKLRDAEKGHDWWHTYRVWKLAKSLGKNQNVDMEIVELGALLHDIADSKFHNGDETVGPKIARDFLKSKISEDKIEHVIKIIENISFSSKQTFKSKELDVVQDADRLDGMGAMGIARTFVYSGYKNREMYNPEIKPQLNMSKEEYKKNEGTAINHFYEKLLLLKDKMNTEKGKEMAVRRHKFMEMYLEEFYREWEGNL